MNRLLTYKIHTSKWHSTHAPLLRTILAKRPEQWTQKSPQKLFDYCDIDKYSRVRNKLHTTTVITSKSFLAKLLKNRTDIYPVTWTVSSALALDRSVLDTTVSSRSVSNNLDRSVSNNLDRSVLNTIVSNRTVYNNLVRIGAIRRVFVSNRLQRPFANPRHQIIATSKEAEQLYNTKGKYFLKPDLGFAGAGIVIVAHPKDITKYLKPKTNYILQQSVPDLLLYQGRKFEFRIWVLLVQNESGMVVYYYQDAVMRLTTVPYDENSLKTLGNVTTSAYYYNNTEHKSDLLSRQEYFNTVFPRALAVSQELIALLRGYFSHNKKAGFEFMGFDFLVNQNLQPILIEINRNIGYYTYPKGVHAPWVAQENRAMMSQFVDDILVPLIQSTDLPIATTPIILEDNRISSVWRR